MIGWGVGYIFQHPEVIPNWRQALVTQHGSWPMMIGFALILFPKLALGLSGFETGVAVMPLIQGDPDDTPQNPAGRIRGAQKLLLTAALIMSVALMGSSFVSTLLIPPAAFGAGGPANGRALAYLAHEHFGEAFGTLYDISTISILWFAGASALAGLLNLVPRYLPRYGMAPEWAKAMRPMVLVFIGITFLVTVLFDADVEAQGGAYATGVLVLIMSASVAVTLFAWRQRRGWIPYLAISLVFLYTTITNMIERPEGLRIASAFIVTIILTSLISRVARSMELRIHGVALDEERADVHRSGRGGGRGADHREPARSGRCRRSTRASCAKRASRTRCARGIRSSSWKCGPTTRRISPTCSKCAASRSARIACCAPRVPRCRTRSPRSCCTSATAPARSRTPISAGPKAIRSSTC